MARWAPSFLLFTKSKSLLIYPDSGIVYATVGAVFYIVHKLCLMDCLCFWCKEAGKQTYVDTHANQSRNLMIDKAFTWLVLWLATRGWRQNELQIIQVQLRVCGTSLAASGRTVITEKIGSLLVTGHADVWRSVEKSLAYITGKPLKSYIAFSRESSASISLEWFYIT